jgi:spore coat protein U-like protein
MTTRLGRLTAAGGTAFCLLVPGMAAAGSRCSVSATNVDFGAYNPIAPGPLPGTAVVSYTCSEDVEAVMIWLGPGDSGSYGSRRMRAGSETLRYNLYADAARTMVWGDCSGGTTCYVRHCPPRDKQIHVAVYGLIPPRQDVGAGTFSDSALTATINF